MRMTTSCSSTPASSTIFTGETAYDMNTVQMLQDMVLIARKC